MLRLALFGRHDPCERYRRIASRMRNVQIAAVAETHSQVPGSHSRSVGTGECADTFDALLSDHAEFFDAVLFHPEDAFPERDLIRAANAGKHILYAGSLPLSGKIVGRVVFACRDAGVRLMIGPSRRFSPAVKAVKESLDAGRLGVPGLLRIHKWSPRSPALHPVSPAVDGPSFQLLLEQIVGEIDLVSWFFSGRPTVVYAVGRPGDYVQLHLGFADGGMALIDLSIALPAGDPYFSLSLIGSTGAAYADDHHNRQLLYQGGPPAALLAGDGEAEAAAQLHEFVGAIREDREPSISGIETLRALEVADVAAFVLKTGRAAPMTGDS